MSISFLVPKLKINLKKKNHKTTYIKQTIQCRRANVGKLLHQVNRKKN